MIHVDDIIIDWHEDGKKSHLFDGEVQTRKMQLCAVLWHW